MSDAAGSTLAGLLGPRALLATVVPLMVAAGPLVWLILAGAPHELDPAAATAALRSVGFTEAALGMLVLAVAAVAAQPLLSAQLAMWAGQPPDWVPLAGRARARHKKLAKDLLDATHAKSQEPDEVASLAAAHELRRRYWYPPASQVVPTTLGNAVLAAVGGAGARYGLNPVLTWPRLYPLLTGEVRGLVNDRRLVLDTTIALVPAWAMSALGWLALLIPARSWLALAAVLPAAAAYLTYRGAIARARAYGEALEVAYDLCRFSLYQALHLPLPRSLAGERKLADRVNQWLATDAWKGGYSNSVDCGDA